MMSMRNAWRSTIPSLALLTVLLSGPVTGAEQETAPGAETPESEKLLTLEELRTFSEVFNQVRRNFVDTVDERDLIRGAIRGMLSELDPDSPYLAAEQYLKKQEAHLARASDQAEAA